MGLSRLLFKDSMEPRSRLAFLPKPFVKRLDGIGKIQRRVLRAVIFHKVQLTNEAEGSRIKIETLVHTGRPAQQDAAHESLSPRQIVPSNQGIGSDVIVELLARCCT